MYYQMQTLTDLRTLLSFIPSETALTNTKNLQAVWLHIMEKKKSCHNDIVSEQQAEFGATILRGIGNSVPTARSRDQATVILPVGMALYSHVRTLSGLLFGLISDCTSSRMSLVNSSLSYNNGNHIRDKHSTT
jgi:hypothetical protein